MNRRYQVFVSSTFEDLEEARKEVSTSILKSDCFPAGMELFPAADLEQFDYIKQVISDCDYFLVVSAGKYGSTHPKTGLSFTEMEYDFAISIGKPTIRLLHKDPFALLPGIAIEQTDKGKKKRKSFRKKLTRSRLVSFWDDTKGLGQQTILALLDIKKRSPSVGWVRGDNALTVEIMKELEALRAFSKSASSKTEQVVKFDDLTKLTEVPIRAATESTDEDGVSVDIATIRNNEIAEAIFISLISNSGTLNIGRAASDILTESYSVPKEYSKYDHVWLELQFERVEHFLHYLEFAG